ncbi:MAG: MarR family transcriptional regulator [Comamonas sp.]
MSLSMTLGVLQRAYRAAADKAVARLGLSHALAWPLVFIHRMGDGVRQGTLAEAMSIEGPSLVRSLDQLVDAGLVQRREDPADRRARTLHLTPQGVRVCIEIEAVLLALRGTLYEGVADADVTACLRVFEVLTHRLGTTPPTPLPLVPGEAP